MPNTSNKCQGHSYSQSQSRMFPQPSRPSARSRELQHTFNAKATKENCKDWWSNMWPLQQTPICTDYSTTKWTNVYITM